MTTRNRNELWAGVLVDELVRAGVREVVVSPGSRSTPVVLRIAARREIRTVVQTDERAAAFFALGVGKATGRPAAVLTTSGTAAANLFPAVVEAAQAETPLLVLTADRPPHLRGADANQAIDQVHLFGRYPRLYAELAPERITHETLGHLRAVAARAVAAAVGDPGGPVHLNLPFAKPLEPTPVPGDVPLELGENAPLAVHGRSEGRPFTRIHRRRAAATAEAVGSLEEGLRGARRPLIVAGPLPRPWETGPAIRAFAAERGIPLLADALSGARYPPGAGDEPAGDLAVVVGSYDLALREPAVRERLRPDFVVRVGASPTSAELRGWLTGLGDVQQVVIDGGERWKDHLAVASEVIGADPALVLRAVLRRGGGRPEDGWGESWRRLEGAARSVVERAERSELFEGEVVGRLARMLDPDDLLFVSGSMPVRDLDAFAPHRSDALTVLGNRGASGIDGIVSTAAGASLSTGRRVVAVVGDLALLHDAAALALLREPGVRVLVVVLNNDGGGIFHLLPVREHEPAFTRFFATPHGRDLSRLAALYDLPHRRLDARHPDEGGAAQVPPEEGVLHPLLDWGLGLGGSGIMEIRTDRDGNLRLREAAMRRARDAVRAALPAGRRPSRPGPGSSAPGPEPSAPTDPGPGPTDPGPSPAD
jgi:2-succinyl-5-enolpyruvyl-6-hydroxy-3-cyclohexene-1-carboxylate synthase